MKLFSIKKSALIWISQLLVALMIITLIPFNTNVSASEDLEALLTEEPASSKSGQLELADSQHQSGQAPEAGEEASGLQINRAEDDPGDPESDQGGLRINAPGHLTVSLILDDQEPDRSLEVAFSVSLIYGGPVTQKHPQANEQDQDPDSGPSGGEDLEEGMEGLSTGLRINKHPDDNSDQGFNETITYFLKHNDIRPVMRNDISDLPAGTQYSISVTLPKDYMITKVEGVDDARESSPLNQSGTPLNLAQTESQDEEGMESLISASRIRELEGSNGLTQAGSLQGIIGSGQSGQVIVHAKKMAMGRIIVSKEVVGDGADREALYDFILEYDSGRVRDVDMAEESAEMESGLIRDQDMIPERQEASERLVLLQANRLNLASSDDERGSGRPINSGQEGGDDAVGFTINRPQMRFSLEAGGTHTIELPAGTSFTLYEVDENNLKEIQTSQSLELEDNKVSGTIMEDGTLEVTFVNEIKSLTGRPGQEEDSPGPDLEGAVSNPADQVEEPADNLETGHVEEKLDEEDLNPKAPEPQEEIQLDLVAGDAEEAGQAEGLEAPVTGEGTSYYLVLALLMTMLSLAGLLLARRAGRGEEA